MSGPLSTLGTTDLSGSQSSITITLGSDMTGSALVLAAVYGLSGGVGVTITDSNATDYGDWDHTSAGTLSEGGLSVLVPPTPLVTGDTVTITFDSSISAPEAILTDWDGLGRWIGYPNAHDSIINDANTTGTTISDSGDFWGNGDLLEDQVLLAFSLNHNQAAVPTWDGTYTEFGSTLTTTNGGLQRAAMSTAYRVVPSTETPAASVTWDTSSNLTLAYQAYSGIPAYTPGLVCPPAELAGDSVTITVEAPLVGDHIEYSLNGGTWTTPDSLPIVLTGLSPGDYTIEVRAANDGGVGSGSFCSWTLTTGGIQIACIDPTIVVGGLGYPPTWDWTSPPDPVDDGPGPDPPTITSFTPSSGAEGDTVIVTGTNLVGATSVRVGGTAASFTITNDTHIVLTIPSGATTGRITISTSGGTATSATDLTITGTGGGGTALFTLGNTDDGTIHQSKTLWVYNRPLTLTQTELVQIAQDCDLVAGQFGSGAHAAAMAAARPGLLLGEYGKSIQKPIDDSDVGSLPELGFEHVVPSGYGTANRAVQGGQYHNYLMEGTRAASFPSVAGHSCGNWAQYLLRQKLQSADTIDTAAGSQVVTLLAYDSCGAFSFNLVSNGAPYDPATGAPYTLAAWLAMVRRFIDVQAGAINADGLFILANGIGITSVEEKKLLSHVDLGMSEGWLTSPSNTVTWPSITRLEAAIDTLIFADSVGSGILCLEKAWSPGWTTALWRQRCRYSAAAFMLGNRGGSLFEFSRSSTRSQYADVAPQLETARDSNLYSMNLGAPTTSPASAIAARVGAGTLQGKAIQTGVAAPSTTDLYRRYFTNGILLLNGSADTIRYVADDTLTRLDGGSAFSPGDLITIPAHSGEFLTT